MNKVYASLFSQIKQVIKEPNVENLLDINNTLASIDVDKMCKYSGTQGRYMMDVFYLTLGEYYDLQEKNWELAKKYYKLSGQPPAKWRLARILMEENPNEKQDVLILTAINTIMKQDTCNLQYFSIRLRYLIDMYYDLNHNVDIYYEILEWILKHKKYVHGSDQDILYRLLEYDIPITTYAQEMIFNDFQQLVM